MVFTEQMIQARDYLKNLGHTVYISSFSPKYVGKTIKEKEKMTIHHKNNEDAIRKFWKKIKICDVVLVLNYKRHGIDNYIGGNTLMEIGFAHVLNKKIFLLNPVPKIKYYQSEIEAVKPVVLDGKMEKLQEFLTN